jgi:hypothetical protein
VDDAFAWRDYDVSFHVELRSSMYADVLRFSKPLVARLAAGPPPVDGLRPWAGPGRALAWPLTPLRRWAPQGSPDASLAPVHYVGCPAHGGGRGGGDRRGSRGNGARGPLRVFLGSRDDGAPDAGTPLLFAAGDHLGGVARAFVAAHRLREKQGAGCAAGDADCMARAIQRLAEAHLVADEEASNRDAAERGDVVANRAEEAATKIEASADVAEAPTVLAEAVAETTAAAAAAAELLPSEASTDNASAREGETSGVVEVGLAAVAVSPVAAQLKARMKERLASALERAKAEAEGAAAARAEAARAEALATAAAPMTPLKSGTPAPKPDGSWEFVLE